ncbi:MAG TPA: M14 family metallocarboxypeptidase [Actinomycetota bacterium]|nr:M14 family metallocarboxypeptidase [Actinomycetota bacterium]
MSARSIPLIVLVALALGLVAGPAATQEPPPQTGFEQRNGDSWTTHQEELDFLATVDARSERVTVSVIGRTVQGRPLHLVEVGYPQPHGREAALAQPTIMFACTQHGNEPAGREGCLKALRDLAFTADPVLIELMSRSTILFIPTANPDGRNANSRGNSAGTDINRDHLGLRTPEAAAIAAVVRDWKPDMSIDLHEYGPSQPVLYDDDVLYLWPRNLNVDPLIRTMGKSFTQQSLKPCVNAAGYTADEYGLQAVGDIDVAQTAGDHDEGIMRNTMGLRHSIGILVETAVSPSTNPQQLPNEAGSTAAQQRRRVASHRTVIDCSLTYFRQNATAIKQATDHAPLRKMGEGFALSAPVYFGGADNQAPAAADEVYPPPCAYQLTAAQAGQVQGTLDLHGVRTVQGDTAVRIPVGQPAEPIIPLLLDARGDRKVASATAVAGVPLDSACTLPPEQGGIPEPGSGAGAAAGGGAATAIGLGALGLQAHRRKRREAEQAD